MYTCIIIFNPSFFKQSGVGPIISIGSIVEKKIGVWYSRRVNKLSDFLRLIFFGVWILVGLVCLIALSKYLSGALPNPDQNNAAMQAAGQQPQAQQQNQGVNPQSSGQIPIQPNQQMQQQIPAQTQGGQQPNQTQTGQEQQGNYQLPQNGNTQYGPQPGTGQ